MKHILLGAAAAFALAGSANAATMIGVDENNNIVTYDSNNPGVFLSSVGITGTTATLLAMDIRDSNSIIYGLGDDKVLYTVNRSTGVAKAVGGPLAISGTNFGFDFNTVVDAIRVVSNDGSNYVVNADTGALAGTFTPVAYGAGDPNEGATPVVAGNAYIHGTTTQFAISTAQDVLVRQANNAGTLTTVGTLGIPVGPRTSFDIALDGTGYLQDTSRFYTVDLDTGLASYVGDTAGAVFGITTAVPEPATWAFMIFGFGAIGGAMRSRRKTNVNVKYA